MPSDRRLTTSVRVRVTLLATLLVTVVLTVGAFLLTRAVEGRLVNDRERAAEAAVGAAVDQVEAGVPIGSITQGGVDQGAGVGIFSTTGDPVGTFTLPVKTIRVLPGNGTATQDVVFISGPATQDVTYDAAPVAVAGTRFYVVGMASLAEVRRSVHTLWSGLRLGIPLVVLAVAIVAWFLAGLALRPVELMRQHERQFLSDASHELRSPLASLRAQLETDDWPANADGVKAEAVRLTHLVDDLMDLAKADEIAVPTTETDLDEVVSEEVAAITPTLSVPVDTSKVGAARLLGDRPALARLVRNLVDNAGRYATSRVEVSLTHADGVATLTVDDDGEGVAEEDRQRIFERFTRTDSSRSRDTGGVGLGLAVVRATARRHGGDVCCATSPLGGARFVVTLDAPG